MFHQNPPRMPRTMDPYRALPVAARPRLAMALAVVAALLLAAGAAHADPPHGHAFRGHFAAGHARPGGRSGGPHWHAGGPARGGRRWAGANERWHGAGRADRFGANRGDWHRRGYGGAGADRWHAGWGGDWGYPERHWHGALWVGGDWDGTYWPPVNYGWNYPWFMPTVPYGAVMISFGGVPYYYVNQVYYAWSPYYDGYVVTNPPPVAGAAGASAAAPPPAAQSATSGGGVLGLRVTPLKGQSAQKSADDRYACDRWAVAQSGFNPISGRQDAQASPQMRSDYRRAFTACLRARGYRVHAGAAE